VEETSTRCEHCNSVITEYYNHRYSGMRGKCMHCMVDFPLE